jgi:hypothetical protein
VMQLGESSQQAETVSTDDGEIHDDVH